MHRHTISQVYIPTLWLLLPFLNPVVKAGDAGIINDEKEAKQRYKRALIFILGYTIMTLIFVIFVYLRKQRCRRINEEAEAAAAQHDEHITTANRKLDTRVIDSFPEIIFPQTDGKFHFTDCHICLEEFKEGEALVMLPTCGHAYHKHCIYRWMATTNSCCPDCRHDYGLVCDHV
ncbi:RING-H2 finger protein ATL80-like [Salvia hispanica]|uniref:RING-H2 finger protein ATL80-like n=1 Tax=Salvia hispanica TaxID=49212 RepID=UPI00200985AE|nr:RING-H2 finger protein ATL80-like [Salvia hispanica]